MFDVDSDSPEYRAIEKVLLEKSHSHRKAMLEDIKSVIGDVEGYIMVDRYLLWERYYKSGHEPNNVMDYVKHWYGLDSLDILETNVLFVRTLIRYSIDKELYDYLNVIHWMLHGFSGYVDVDKEIETCDLFRSC